MSFKTIRNAQSVVWPQVRDSLDRVRASREAVKTERNPSRAAQSRARLPWNRVVANETVWALAKANLLNTPEQVTVLKAAARWVETWDGIAPDGADEPEDRELYAAVTALQAANVDDTPARLALVD